MKRLKRYLVILEVWGCIDMSGEMMTFPESPQEFIEQYSFTDKEKVYTNGSELIPVFRVHQMLEYYTRKPMERIIERIENARQKYQRLVKEQGEKEDEAMNIHFRGVMNIVKEEGEIDD